jgi:hypothetical protein
MPRGWFAGNGDERHPVEIVAHASYHGAMLANLDVQQALLKHFLAAIAYRTPHELIWHMTGLVGYARTHFLGGVWQPEKLPTFDQEILRFHDVLEDLGRLLEENLFGKSRRNNCCKARWPTP